MADAQTDENTLKSWSRNRGWKESHEGKGCMVTE